MTELLYDDRSSRQPPAFQFLRTPRTAQARLEAGASAGAPAHRHHACRAALVETFSHQRLLFASLASSAFLIYLDPLHGTNSIKTLVTAQFGAAVIGFFTASLLNPGYGAASLAMLVTIGFMIVIDAVHPPAVSTALSFAFRASSDSNLLLFAFALGVIVILVLLEKVSLWVMARSARGRRVRSDV